MALDPAKIDLLVGKLTQAIERLEHLEIKLRAAGGGAPADAVSPTQRGVADKTRKDAAGGYAPIEPHQAGFAKADAEHGIIPGGAGYNQAQKFKPGSWIRVNKQDSTPEQVMSTNGNMVKTYRGNEYHATKVVPAQPSARGRTDAAFEEGKHPRSAGGQFGSGGGGKAAKPSGPEHVPSPGGAGYNQAEAFKPGSMIRVNKQGSKPEEVHSTSGNTVKTLSGNEYHATKVVPHK